MRSFVGNDTGAFATIASNIHVLLLRYFRSSTETREQSGSQEALSYLQRQRGSLMASKIFTPALLPLSQALIGAGDFEFKAEKGGPPGREGGGGLYARGWWWWG